MEKLRSWLQLAGVVCGLVGGLYAGVSAVWGSVVTTDELIDHDLASRAHPPLRDLIEQCQARTAATEGYVRELRDGQTEMGARIIRLVSADLERNPALRAARSTFFEDQYRGLIRHGLPVDEALIQALHTPWHRRLQ